jgi:spore photoproduct lyase
MIYVDREAETHPRTEAILKRLPPVPTELVTDVRELKHITDITHAKKEWILTKHRGRSFKPCQGIPTTPLEQQEEGCISCPGTPAHLGPGIRDDHICCCYYIMDLVSGCPMDCSYCILQSYLENNPRTQIFVNVEEILADVMQHLERYPDTTFRIGTGELGDSLALDPITGFSETLVPFFAEEKLAILELKTKTDFVDHLLDLRHNDRTVVSWSVNSERIVREEEHFAASLDKRLDAARKCVEAGYRVGFHFDPIIITAEDDITEYEQTIDRIFDAVDPEHMAWVSLGLLRLPYSMKAVAQRRFPNTRIFSGEIVPAGNKLRYPRFLRTQYYKPLWDRLTRHLPQKKVYMCMETKAVWEKFDGSIACHGDLERRLTT